MQAKNQKFQHFPNILHNIAGKAFLFEKNAKIALIMLFTLAKMTIS